MWRWSGRGVNHRKGGLMGRQQHWCSRAGGIPLVRGDMSPPMDSIRTGKRIGLPWRTVQPRAGPSSRSSGGELGIGPPNWNCGLRLCDSPWLAVRHREVDVGHLGPPVRHAVGSSASDRNCRSPIDNCQWGRGFPPWLAVRHREVHVGCARYGPNAIVGRTASSTTGLAPPIGHELARESISHVRACLPFFALFVSAGFLAEWRGDPHWLTVRHREVDVGHWPRGAPKQRKRHAEWSPELVEGRSEGSARLDQILRLWETSLRMTERFGSDPPWLAVRHREVDVGHVNPPERHAVGSSGSISDCRLSICDWRLGRGSPPWLAVQHREVDIGHRPRGAPTRSESHPERSEGSDIPVKDPNLAAGKTSVRMTQNIAEI